ncbi:hypothetical protein AB0M36_18105 [Actinoplanes sp. NPDC051346]|uniref:hypothetical protein n=1 Tax=Actinoplanes sp. NPDC051346 TaxID=3155048 RepID=UPI003444BE1C
MLAAVFLALVVLLGIDVAVWSLRRRAGLRTGRRTRGAGSGSRAGAERVVGAAHRVTRPARRVT